jgi:hypothetical protein
MKIRQRKEECHFETSIEESIEGGYMPVSIGYGFTKDEADTKALQNYKNKSKESK